MVSEEQIAHDLTMVYLNNRYGINVDGMVNVSDGHGYGQIDTERFPSVLEVKYKKVGTGERVFFGFERHSMVEDGYKSDDIIDGLICEYYQTYNRILTRLQ